MDNSPISFVFGISNFICPPNWLGQMLTGYPIIFFWFGCCERSMIVLYTTVARVLRRLELRLRGRVEKGVRAEIEAKFRILAFVCPSPFFGFS